MDLFIIGAGAHKPYGFPTGADLKEDIRGLQKTSSENKLREKVLLGVQKEQNRLDFNKRIEGKFQYAQAMEYHEFMLEFFVHEFLDAACPTIDAFLSKRKDLKVLGKFIIATILRHYEQQDSLRTRGDDWLQVFLAKYVQLDDSGLSLKKFPVVVTFNYDRLLELAIIRRLESFYELSEQDAQRILQGLPIFHVYGKVEVDNKVKINCIERWDQVLSASSNIKVIGEERDRKLIVEPIYEALEDFHGVDTRCYILGFGYDKYNSQLLFDSCFSFVDRKFDIYSSSYGLPESNRVYFKRLVTQDRGRLDKIQINGLYTNTNPPKHNLQYTCMDVLRMYL